MFDADALIETIRRNQDWALPFTFALAFGESLAFISFLVPATVVLLALGALVATGALEFWPLWLAAFAGCVLGDVVSYAAGWMFPDRALKVWPFSRAPDLPERAERFFKRWGVWGIVLGKFVGPLRATLPLTAGIARMDRGRFAVATVLSGALWAAAWLAPGLVTGAAVAAR